MFKSLLASPKDRSVSQDRFFEYFSDKASKITGRLGLRVVKRVPGPKTPQNRNNDQGGFYEDFSFESDYNIFKTSVLSDDDCSQGLALLKDDDKENIHPNRRASFIQRLNFESPNRPPKVNRWDGMLLRPSLKIVDLSDKWLPGSVQIRGAGPDQKPSRKAQILRAKESSTKKATRQGSQVKTSSRSERSSSRLQVSKVSADKSDSQSKGNKRDSRFSKKSEEKSYLSQLVTFGVREPEMPAKNLPKQGQFWTHSSNREDPDSGKQVAGKTRETSARKHSSNMHVSTRASSIQKESSATKHDDLPSNLVFELVYELMKKEAQIELVRAKLCYCDDLNLEKLFNTIDNSRCGFLTESRLAGFLASLGLKLGLSSLGRSLNPLMNGRKCMNFLHFCELFFPASRPLFAKMKTKVQTLAPQFEAAITADTRLILRELFELLLSLETVKDHFRGRVDQKSIDEFCAAKNHGGVNKATLIECIESYGSLALHCNQVKERVAEKLADQVSECLTLASVEHFLASN